MRYNIAGVELCGLDSRARPPSQSDAFDTVRPPRLRAAAATATQVTYPSRGAVVGSRRRRPAPDGALGMPHLGRVDGLRAAGVIVRGRGCRAAEGECHDDIAGSRRHRVHGNEGRVEAERRRVEDEHRYDGW